MDLKEMQDAEIEAVQAIFMDDYAEVESRTPWKTVNAVHEFTLRILPTEERGKELVHLVLHFKLPKAYPKLPPQVAIRNPAGLTAAEREAVLALVKETASRLLGSEMIYEIATTVATYLTEETLAMRFQKLPSLGVNRDKRAEEADTAAALQAQQAEREASRLRAEDEARRQAEAEAADRAREAIRAERIQEENRGGPVISGSDLALVEHFNKGLRLPGNVKADLLVKGPICCRSAVGVVFHAEALASDKHSLRLPVSCHTIDFDVPYFTTVSGQRKLEKLEEELADLVDLRHASIVGLYGSQRKSIEDSVSRGWRLDIVTEPLPRTTLLELLEDAGPLKSAKAIPYFRQLADALVYIHGSDFVHRNISAQTVHIGRSQAGDAVAKLSSGTWMQALYDMHRSNRYLAHDPMQPPREWVWPTLHAHPLAIRPRQDIWDFGVMMAQALCGADMLRVYRGPSPFLAEYPASPLRELLGQIFGSSPVTATDLRKSLYDLPVSLESASTGASQSTSYGQSHSAPWQALSMSPPAQQQSYLHQEQSGLFFQPKPLASASRYRSEFEEVEKLGQGGFGQVVKARNKLDNHFYAIKKVKLPSDPALEQKILREVTIWGRLSHPGIVRYHTSWVETDTTSTDVRQALDLLTSSTNGTPSRSTSSDDASTSGSDESLDGSLHGEEFDLGFDDFISKGHQSKSLSMPTIHFGEEDDPSNEPSRAVSRQDTPEASTPPITSSPRQSRTLYMQMEFVSGQTLREQIDDGISEADMWRFLRQILLAMKYYTGFNIIHRDLKPSNILLDNDGNVRIADFGLAVEQASTELLQAVGSSRAQLGDPDLTSDVGTSLYLAPESTGRRKAATDRGNRYTDKIDMYSLGIIIFEMCWPIQTRMERLDVLKAMRRPEIVFPSSWDDSDPKRVRHSKIIKWCLASDPAKRAAPSELLQSSLLPAVVHDEHISDTLALLAKPNSPHINSLLQTLFQTSRDVKRPEYLAYDAETDDTELNNPHASRIRRRLEAIFSLHGAVEFQTPLLMPASEIYDEKTRKAVRLLSRQGLTVQLPYDAVLPLAKLIARDDSITRLKRWSISPVYREDPMGGQPRSFLAASYDLVSTHRTLAAEAECLSVVDEILSATTTEDDIIHVLGHYDFTHHLLATLPPNKAAMALRALERYESGTSPWTQVAGEMIKLGMSHRTLDELAALDVCAATVDIPGKANEDIRAVIAICRKLGVERKILVSPLLTLRPELHRGGICFQSRKKKDVYAEGGRYDQLIDELAKRRMGRSQVGVTIALSKLSRGMPAVKRCDVYIVSYSPGLIEARLAVAHELWKNHISADLMYDDHVAPDRLARKEGIRYLVIVKASRWALKDLSTGHEVQGTDLVGLLKDKLRSRRRD